MNNQAFYITTQSLGETLQLVKLFEGNEEPCFMSREHPYLFGCRHETNRVLWRLQARYPDREFNRVDVSRPIDWRCHYCDKQECCGCGLPEQHLACFI